MDKRKLAIGATTVGVLVLAAWAFGFIGGGDPVVAEMQQLRNEMFANRDLPREERRAQWEGFRERVDSLSEDQRRALWQSGREQWQQMAQQRMDEFFELPPEKQRERLDEIIDRMEGRRRERAENGDRGGDRGGRGGGNLSDSQREQRRKERLDRTSPKMRAQFSEFQNRLNDRRQERGLPPVQGRGGRGFGGGGPWRG